MLFWIGIDIEEQLPGLRSILADAEQKLGIAHREMKLPVHISLKMPFEAEGLRAEEIYSALERFASAQKPFTLKVKGIEEDGTIVWIRTENNESIDAIHEGLITLVQDSFGAKPHEYDLDCRYHSTLFMDDDRELTARAYEIFKGMSLPESIVVNKFIIGCQPEPDDFYKAVRTIDLRKDIKALNSDELQALVTDMGEKKFRAAQIYEWLHKKLATEWDEMTNIPKKLRDSLAVGYYLPKLEIVTVLKSESDGTEKFLFRLADGNVIESVLMRYEHGNSVCISSQVGCRMGCNFCASTIGGRIRDLSAGEMLEQVYHIQRYDNQRVSNVVVMGTGEPFDNFDNFCRFYECITDEKGLNISGRNITVSTCGIVPKIRELADHDYTLTLAVSLHSPTDELRRTFMPIANKYSIAEIMDACDYYFEKTGRRITFEYSLIAGVNDSKECALTLAGLLKGKNAHVNLIPVNPVKERNYTKTSADGVAAFKNLLEKNRINATIRRGMGKDIDAACGQLRRSYTQNVQEQG